MTLPNGFTFSQASLQDYSDCPRRFQLRYVLRVRWPAAHESTPDSAQVVSWEVRAQQGTTFHRLVHQHTVGVPEANLTGSITDSQVQEWWQAYLCTPPPGLPTQMRRSEVRLSASLEGHRLMARYDLLAMAQGQKTVIVDWKTSRLRPRREWLARRWQTRVYRHVLVAAGSHLNGGTPLLPSQVELVYWFTNYPQQAERFPYDQSQYADDQNALRESIQEICGRNEEQWTLTDDLKRCRYCPYRTLCERVQVDGPEPDWDPPEEPEDWEIDLDQVGEIAF